MFKFLYLILIVSVSICLAENNNYLHFPIHNQYIQTPEVLPSRDNVKLVRAKIVQKLDNFDAQNQNTFNQRYFHLDNYYKPGGPIFILVGNQQPFTVDAVEINYYLILDIVKRLNGYFFALEHRYYGQSSPFKNLTTENLRYLTTDQALADIAHFIPYIKSKYIPRTVKYAPVVLAGFQYGGGLVSWFRQKYPHLVAGAWASSATLLAKIDNNGYNEIVGQVYRELGGTECYRQIENGFEAMDNMIANNRSAELSEMLGLCSDMGNGLGASTWLSVFSQLFGRELQDKDNDIMCRFLANTNATDDLGRLVEVARYIFGADTACVEISYELVIEAYKESYEDSPAVQLGVRQFVYQECSALGWFPSSSSSYQPFGSGFSTDLFYNICKDTFGNKFDKTIIDRNEYHFNNLHGGLAINVTNTIFTQGERDPFRVLGIQNDPNNFSPVFVIPGYPSSHDFLIPLESDTVEMKEIKQRIEHIIAHWVSPRNNIDGI